MEDFELDVTENTTAQAPAETKQRKRGRESSVNNSFINKSTVNDDNEDALINPLRDERVVVRYIAKRRGIWGNNPKHVLAGGMSDNAIKTFVVPKLMSGIYVNVLTDNEKRYLENALGLEENAMSIYRKTDNFWSDANPNGINQVKLKKQDNFLNLSIPEDYIKYKILLANRDYIAPSLEALQDRPKATYQFVIINEGNEHKVAKTRMTYTMSCYKEYGKIEDDRDKLRVIVETIMGRPTAENTKLDFLQTKCNELIQSDAKLFLKVIQDPYLDTKVLIRKSIEAGNIVKRGNFYYLRNANETVPLCENNEEPTFNTAAKYLNAPKHQEVMLSLQAKLKY